MDPYIFCDFRRDMMPLFIASEFLKFVIIGVYTMCFTFDDALCLTQFSNKRSGSESCNK